MERKWLEIGPGSTERDSTWLRMDCEPGEQIDLICQWGAEPIPLPDESMELIYASHVLEHVPWYQTKFAMREAWRVLRPYGRFEVHVPDFDVLMEAVRQKRCLDDHAENGFNRELHWMHWVAERLFHMAPDSQWHRACFNAEHLEWCLLNCGFGDIKRLDSERGTDHGVVNLGMGGVKIPKANQHEED